jgi:FkbM family methyltransferase
MTTPKKLIRALVPREIRNWLRSPQRSLEWSFGELKHALGANQIVQIRPEWSLRSHPVAYRFAYHAHDDDPEQVAEFESFISRCCSGMVLFDIGAHFGLFSLAALHYGGASAKAIAVDPSPTAARICGIQAKLNSLTDRLTVVQASVGDQCGSQSMVSAGVLASGYYVLPAENHSGDELTSTEEVTLDSLAEKFMIEPTHIKIDVEGSERNVLEGGTRVLSQSPAPLLFVELHNQIVRERGEDPAEILGILKNLGYELYSTDGARLIDKTILNTPLIRVMAVRV